MFASLLAAESPAAAPEVRGDTQCPRPHEVAALLGRMAGSDGAAGDVAELREEAGALVVVLRRASGEIVGEKRVPASLACGVRAEIVAVSIAALEAQLAGGEAPPLVVPVAPPPTPEAGPPVLVMTRADVAPAPSPLTLEVGAAVLASFNGTDAAPAGRVEVAVGRASSRWSLSLAGTVVGPHSVTVGPGVGTWWRWGAEISLRREVPLDGQARLQARAGFALTALDVDGGSYPRNVGDTLLDPGPVAALRLITIGGRLRPWLELSGAYWPRSHELSVKGTDQVELAAATVPRAEVFLGVGASFGGGW